MPDVVNDALAISQHVVQHLGQSAIQYLLAIEQLTIEHWRNAYYLIDAGTQNRTTKEAFIKDIVTYFVNTDTDISYCIKTLSLLPGFQPEALQLYSYTASSLYAVQQATSQAAAVQRKNGAHADLATFRVASTTTTSPTSVNHEGESPNTQPQSYSTIASGAQHINKRKPNKQQSNPWTYGKDYSRTNSQAQQLQYMCLAFRSGPEESVESLSTEIERWKELTNLQIDAVSKSQFSTMFRVQFRTPVLLAEKWTSASTWQPRISVRPWKGDPRKKLAQIETREYQKKIYVGNLTATISLDQVLSNMKKIYREELEDGTISKIEVFENEEATKRQLQYQHRNSDHIIRKSVCVLLTSKPGGFSEKVGLKQERYPAHMQRAVRPWNGRVPWPKDNNNQKVLALNWC